MTDQKENPAQCSNTATGLDMSNGKPLNLQTPQPPHGVKNYLLVTLTSGVTFKLSSNTRLANVLLQLVASGEKGISPLDFALGVRLSAHICKLRAKGLIVDDRRQRVAGDPYGQTLAIYWIPEGTLLSVSH